MAIKKPYVLILFGAVIFIFHSCTTYQRVQLEVIGKIVSKENSHYKNHPNRPFTVYKLQSLSTGEEFTYKADAIDPALSRNLQIGSIVEKQKGNIDYLVDKNKIQDFPKGIYFTAIFLGGVLVIFGCINQLKLIKKWLTNHYSGLEEARRR
jgi:hypothetical protein